MIEEVAHRTLSAWDLDGAEISLVAQRENIVFRVKGATGSQYALRLHRPGYQSRQMMLSELAWMRHLGAEGLIVPSPVPARSGTLLVDADGYLADLLTWLAGKPMGATGAPLDLADRQGTFRHIGRMMAKVHQISDLWVLPDGFQRNAWDIEGLLGEAPLWDRFWDNPGLSAAERERVMVVRDRLREDLESCDLDYGLIHADMVRENVLINTGSLGLIDFDDSGFGFRLFDVATALLKNRSEPDFVDLRDALLNGYRSVRPLDTSLLMQFTLIRALTYLGWIISRMDEPNAQLRQQRFMRSTIPLVNEYLDSRSRLR